MSKRIERLVDLFPGATSVADIGCDHGYSSILLAKKGKAEKIIACDIGESPLESAKNNIRKEGLTNKIQCRLGNGLEPLKSFEVEALLISGMGGPLITEIVEKRIEEFSLAVFSPQSDFSNFRRFLAEKMEVLKEEYLEEGGKFYRLFLAGKKEKKEETEETAERSYAEWEYGWIPLQQKDPVLKVLLEKEKRQYGEILEKRQVEEVQNKLAVIEEALGFYRENHNG